MDFEDNFLLDSSSPKYKIGDTIGFFKNDKLFFGFIKNIPYHNYSILNTIFYEIQLDNTNEKVLIPEDDIIDNYVHDFLLFEIDEPQINKYLSQVGEGFVLTEVKEYEHFSILIV